MDWTRLGDEAALLQTSSYNRCPNIGFTEEREISLTDNVMGIKKCLHVK